jgi:hypothetical protein
LLPQLTGQLPPASVTDPGTDPSAPVQTPPSLPVPTPALPSLPTADDVANTVKHLAEGLTGSGQHDLASTLADTATNVLDAVGQLGDQVAQTVDGTVGGLLGGLLGGSSSSP